MVTRIRTVKRSLTIRSSIGIEVPAPKPAELIYKEFFSDGSESEPGTDSDRKDRPR